MGRFVATDGPNSALAYGVPGSMAIDALLELSRELGPQAWRACSDAAQVVASYLLAHPRVLRVRYPGLRADPLYPVASCTLESGFGPVVSFEDRQGAWHIFDSRLHGDAQECVLELESAL